MPAVKQSSRGIYPRRTPKQQENVIREAVSILEKRLRKSANKAAINSAWDAKLLARLELEGEEREHFWVAFLNTRHHLIDHKILFSGTVDSASVYPREVVKEALRLNAAAVLFAHNHPSGTKDPSKDDQRITEELAQALALVDIRVLDHIIIGQGEPLSMAEKGLM